MKLTVSGLSLEVEGDYCPREHDSMSGPGCPESFTAVEVRIPGNPANYIGILSEKTIEEIEDTYLTELHDRARWRDDEAADLSFERAREARNFGRVS